MAAINGLLIGRINRNAEDKLRNEMQLLLSEAADFQAMPADVEKPDYYVAVDDNGQTVGYALRISGSGFADKIGLLVAFSADLNTIRGVAVLSSSETPGFGDKINNPDWREQYTGKPANESLFVTRGGTGQTGAEGEIMGITGATISSQAVTDIVNQACADIRELVESTSAGN